MIPSAGTPIKIKDIINAVLRPCDFEDEIKKVLAVKYAFTVNSGTTAFYIILKALKRLSDKTEIILPAYTAPSLILPIKKAGLKYKLVDISLDTFNMDIEKTIKAVSDNTLAILCVHMFGLPMDIEKIKNEGSVFVIEDAASSFGTRRIDKFTGAFGNVGFISFNRGKNLSTVSGGVVAASEDKFAKVTIEEINKLPYPDFSAKAKIFFKALGLSFAVRPWFYTIFMQFISQFKYTTLHEDFDSLQYTRFQGYLGCSLLKRSEEIFKGREEKGRLLYNALKHISGVRLPVMPDGWNVVFNQFPFIVEDAKKRIKVLDAIITTGVEATILYDKPIHKIYGNDSNQKFPNAEYMADRLVLIPVHHYATVKSLYRVIEAIEETIKS